MPATAETPAEPSSAFLKKFRERAGASASLPFDAFMELALYDPEVGYYTRDRLRVGQAPGTDFYTATSAGSLFGELIGAACRALAPAGELSQLHFVEVGAEPNGGVLRDVAHPFASARTLRRGDALIIPDRAVVFSNELFDAQPFRRFVWRGGTWRELGVRAVEKRLEEIELSAMDAAAPLDRLPRGAAEGYHLDLPLRASELLRALVAPSWRGLFVAFDYGKTWEELATHCPAGTARAYFRHQQSNDLLARPSEQDLTCHVCWDWLIDELRASGFADPRLDWQESFFVHHAGDFIAQTMEAEATRLGPRKLALMQLLHPANLGQKFQVLHAWRE